MNNPHETLQSQLLEIARVHVGEGSIYFANVDEYIRDLANQYHLVEDGNPYWRVEVEAALDNLARRKNDFKRHVVRKRAFCGRAVLYGFGDVKIAFKR